MIKWGENGGRKFQPRPPLGCFESETIVFLICCDCNNENNFRYNHEHGGLSCSECGGRNISIKKEFINE